MHLTDRMIRGLRPLPHQHQRVVADRGLEIVVTKTRKSFRARTQIGKRIVRKVLGEYPGMTLAAAREVADDWIKKQRRLAGALRGDTLNMTVSDLLHEWHEVHLSRERKMADEPKRAIEKDIIPALGTKRLREVTRRDLVLALDGVVARGSVVMADHLRSMLMQMFDFGVDRGLIEDSPARRLPKARKGKHGEARDRVLDDEELRRVWWALANARDDIPKKYRERWLNRVRPYTKRCLKLLLLTGVRRSEAVLAAWSEIDLREAMWVIPPERTKTAKQHAVPLTDLAVDVLREQLEFTEGREFVFASPIRNFEVPILASAVSQAIADNRTTMSVDKFVVHDLRRTVRSRLSSLGVDNIVARKILNHSLDGMDRVYDRHDYLKEKRVALQRWADELSRILDDEPKVIALPARVA